MQTIGLDTEFNKSSEKKMNVICAVACASKEFSFNFTDPTGVHKFKKFLDNQKDFCFIAHAAGAEARSLLSLGINPLDYQWIDTYVEWIMLCNSNNKWAYGSYLDKEGNKKFSKPPVLGMSDEDKKKDLQDRSERPKNLVNALYALLGVEVSTDQKHEMRDLIISGNQESIEARMPEILDYCASDTKYLRALDLAIQKAYEEEGLHDFRTDQLRRGRYSVATALCEDLGIPIDLELLDKIIKKTPEILDSHKEEVNKHFNFFVPEYQKPPKTFKNGKIFHYKVEPAHKDMSAYQNYVQSLNITKFPRTEGGKFKSDKDTLEQFGYWGGLEELWKYNRTESCLKWFNKSNGDGFFSRMGSDDCVRPYFGIFGTQTGRNAAKAKTFPLAMSSWLRTIIRPKKGEVIIASDFSQQEVYVAAILSGDKNLLAAYNSGDVYLSFAIQAGLAPKNATKKSHKEIRNLCKSTVLGLQFGMGKLALQRKLCLDSKTEVSMEQTEQLVAAHKDTFADYWRWVRSVAEDYKAGAPLVTSDGWVLWQDNEVMTSVTNYMVQGSAAAITRDSVIVAWECGLPIMCSLHDADYARSSMPSYHIPLLEKIMIESTAKILGQKIEDCTIRIDTKVISHEDLFLEEKGIKDWERLKNFFE